MKKVSEIQRFSTFAKQLVDPTSRSNVCSRLKQKPKIQIHHPFFPPPKPQAGLPRDVCKGLASEIRKDAVTLRFKDELVRRMTQTLRELNFLVEDGEEHD